MESVGRRAVAGGRTGPQEMDVKSLLMWSAEEEEAFSCSEVTLMYQDDVSFELKIRQQPLM